MNKKKIVAILITTSLLLTSLVGCVSKENSKDKSHEKANVENSVGESVVLKDLSDYVGDNYNDFSKKNGDGSEHIEKVEGKKVIISSSYPTRMFNYNADLILDLDDSKNISAVSVHFKGVSIDNILEDLKKELGNPEIKEDKENGDSKDYSWEKEGFQYKLSQVGEEIIITVNKSSI